MSLPFHWRCPTDATSLCSVSISPESGQLAPHSAETITVSFEALNVQRYQLQLLMDLAGMAQGVLAVPLLAEAAVPRMQLSCPVLEYGECFMGYSYQRSITLVNESKLPARFEVLDQVGRGA